MLKKRVEVDGCGCLMEGSVPQQLIKAMEAEGVFEEGGVVDGRGGVDVLGCFD